MLQKEFFQVQPFNPNPYWDPVIVNLSGAQKFEEDTVFVPGRYKIEVAPGLSSTITTATGSQTIRTEIAYIEKTEIITDPFIVRAYCGSDAPNATTPGTNPYSGEFKVNAVDARTLSNDYRPNGIDVSHIFGAGGGNAYCYSKISLPSGPTLITNTYVGGGCNCLGNGSIITYDRSSGLSNASGAGSCLHILPVGGVFGTNYIRAYHINGFQHVGAFGSVYGGGACPYFDVNYGSGNSYWYTRGGNSPFGNGGTSRGQNGLGIGGGRDAPNDLTRPVGGCSAVYFNGNSWVNDGTYVYALNNGIKAQSSYIRITYLGPLD